MKSPRKENASEVSLNSDTEEHQQPARIRAVAVSAPDWISGAKAAGTLNSSDPASLFNACRYAANLAQKKIGPWAASNWAISGPMLRKLFLLMYSLDDMDQFEALILSERPNFLLLGAMTLCMPGAIECAKAAKRLLGDEVLIVLGGRHANETIYLNSERIRAVSSVCHHLASPGRLIRTREIPPVFDIIISGEAEHIIAEIGEALTRHRPSDLKAIAANLRSNTPGFWIADIPACDLTTVSKGIQLCYDEIPSPVSIFGVSASFPIFGGRMTSHVFSDTGRGCVYDCAFCSERRSVAGAIQDIKGAPLRLYRQLKDSELMIVSEYPDRGASAFIEDSILLSGSQVAIDQFCQLFENNPINIIYGGQFTIDQILRRKELIRRLARNGLRYVFVGVETFDPNEIGGISKDIDNKGRTWQERFSEALSFLKSTNISCGCALLFGLGEPHASRVTLVKTLINYRKEINQPVVISANWAVQHPLKDCPESANENYLRWGTPQGPLLEAFHKFGEASLEYPLKGVAAPILLEVEEIITLLEKFEAIHE